MNASFSYNQAAEAVLMIRPKHFGYNNETAKTNVFQHKPKLSHAETSERAIKEFDHFVELLKKYDVDVVVINYRDLNITPDAVFPNNWFSTHPDGKVILYPMLAENRRMEVRREVFEILEKEHYYHITDFKDYTFHAIENVFLEGTGSIVFDHANRLAYANMSSRTSHALFKGLCEYLNYEPVFFWTSSKTGNEIYHTNVMLTITETFAVVCPESIQNSYRSNILNKLSSTGHEVIPITFEQMEKFAGNMLQVKNKIGELITIMSQTAFACLTEQQLEIILRYSKILPIPVPTIESIGGGSVRCMMAEIFLPKAGTT